MSHVDPRAALSYHLRMKPTFPLDPARRPVRLAVIGGSRAPEPVLHVARQVGQIAGERGALLICGGHQGVMEAACRGAKEAGGVTVGILRGCHPKDANPYVDIPIPTGMNEGRNVIVALSGEAIIAIGGAFGTLSEMALARVHGREVVGLHTLEFAPALGVHLARTPVEAVEMATRFALESRH